MSNSDMNQTLHNSHVYKLRAILSRTYSLCNLIALIAIFYYRGAYFFNKNNPKYYMVPFLPWFLVFGAELLMSFMWVLKQPIYWRPVARIALPENLPKDEELPGIDVLICTADAEKEPTFDVMNTVISAMALDYPANKISVYLSDDGGYNVTLNGMKEAWIFATWWLPFVRRYNVKPVCPRAYFEHHDEEVTHNKEFIQDRELIKAKYEIFKQRVQNRMGKDEIDVDAKKNTSDHPALIQVINGNAVENETSALINPEHTDDIPFLVYLAREKRPSRSHYFKAGALNVLLRVSSILTNAPYIIVLDCDMYCNDSLSARQAMCFHLDPNISSSLGWVQFPHKFHNISQNDIYDSQMRTCWQVLFPGFNGFQGPILGGTNFYLKRKALYGDKIDSDISYNMKELKYTYGASNEFIDSLSQSCITNVTKGNEISSALLKEAHRLASCTYEQGTKWGEKVGFKYGSVVEDVMTSLALQRQGWRSVYLNPTKPQFLGSATTNLDLLLSQGTRWNAGLLQIGLSKYCPLISYPSKMHIVQKMFSTWIVLFPFEFISISCLAIIPPICFVSNIPLYPKVFDPFFGAFAFVFISSHLKSLYEFLISGGSVSLWLGEQRTNAMKSVTCYVYGTLVCIMAKLGLREAKFIPTNKAEDEDTTKWYQAGKFDFRTSNMFLVPIVVMVTLNLFCFVGGVARMIIARNWDTMLAQGLLSLYALILSVPVIEGMLLRKDTGRIQLFTSFIAVSVSMGFLSLGYLTLLH